MIKNSLFVGMVISLGWYIIWLLGYGNLGDYEVLERQNYSILANLKFLLVIALYIAWRITPESKK